MPLPPAQGLTFPVPRHEHTGLDILTKCHVDRGTRGRRQPRQDKRQERGPRRGQAGRSGAGGDGGNGSGLTGGSIHGPL